MDLAIQAEKAATFRKRHDGSRILVLPNAWDVASARLLEAAGFAALATTSAGVAWVLGYPDGERIPRDVMLDAVRRIVGRVSVPVTADMVAGFGPSPEHTAQTVHAVIAAGAVGLNLEDSTGDPSTPLVDMTLQVERIQAARAAATADGVPVVINARTDVFLAAVGAEATRIDHAVRRANAYRKAGADCLFVPGVQDSPTIAGWPNRSTVRSMCWPAPARLLSRSLPSLEWRGSAWDPDRSWRPWAASGGLRTSSWQPALLPR